MQKNHSARRQQERRDKTGGKKFGQLHPKGEKGLLKLIEPLHTKQKSRHWQDTSPSE
jgi:hypothetical protein